MSIVSYKCDRCGLIFRKGGLGYQTYPVVTDSKVARVTTYGHLCPDCEKSFNGWMEEGACSK